MIKHFTLFMAAMAMTLITASGQSEEKRQREAQEAKRVDTRVDNNRYWKLMAEQGLARLNPVIPVPPAIYVGSDIGAFSAITEDSPDVAVASNSSTQSENSIFVDPADEQVALNSNNSTPNPASGVYGANSIKSTDGGASWNGSVQGAGGPNSGDPVALIGLDRTYFVGFISESGGQAIARSTNQGSNYTVYNVANASGGGLLDKNHMWIDNSPSSPFEGNLYNAWTDFGGAFDSEIALSRSANGGMNWSTPVNVSAAVNAGSHCQGVNINTGPNGEVYAIWAIYDGWPTDESAIGMARSFDGGATWQPATRIINNIRGIRNTGVGKNMRNNAFPSMAVDISGGDRNGYVYIVWSNVGVPGVNNGNDVDVYISRSADQGTTWSVPVRVNQDPSGLGRKHYFPWITCDPVNGILSVVFYDDRNVGGNQCEVFCANSYDGGETWEDFRVSDVAFTPTPIPGLADGYMGDYLGINARGGWVYPTWADNRTGSVMTYVSPYQTNPLSRPRFLEASVEFETGLSALQWSYTEEAGFTHFNVYREGELIGTATDTVYSDNLPDYGVYNYRVTAYYEGIGESSPATGSVQWGDAQISVEPDSIFEILRPDSSVTRYITVTNIGQLEMDYNISMFIPSLEPDNGRAYCEASGTCDEFISRVQLAEIDNTSGCTQYGDYTALTANLSAGSTYQITVTNGNPVYSDDKCGLWIDWNQNQVFDAEEEITMSGSPGVGPYTAEILVPTDAKPGLTRLRTRIVYFGLPEPCGATWYGEAEDYSVNVLTWIIPDPVSGNVAAGNDTEIGVTLSAAGLEPGEYTAEISIFSNDPDDPEVVVPVTLVVSEIDIEMAADQEVICLGESVRLTPEVSGGSGAYTYSWVSSPEGFVSEESSPVVTPDTTTMYTVQVTDGTHTIAHSISIIVNPVPEVSLGADTLICLGESVTLEAGEGFASYLWSSGETTPSITIGTSGEFWVEVMNEYGCSRRDTMLLTVNDVPAQASITDGPASVDNYFGQPSGYACSELENTLSYTWSLSPEAAGVITGDGVSAVVSWAAGFTGEAQIAVTAANECGDGPISAAFVTSVFTSQGLGEMESQNTLKVYPNPGTGRFSVRLPSGKPFTGSLMVTDGTGTIVLFEPEISIQEHEARTINLSGLPAGQYTVNLEDKEKSYSGRLILQRK